MDGSFEHDDAQAGAANVPAKRKGLLGGMATKNRRLTLMIVPPVIVAGLVAAWLYMTAGYISTDNAQISAARADQLKRARAR